MFSTFTHCTCPTCVCVCVCVCVVTSVSTFQEMQEQRMIIEKEKEKIPSKEQRLKAVEVRTVFLSSVTTTACFLMYVTVCILTVVSMYVR